MRHTSATKILLIFCLVVAGEAIFALPFHLTRFFRPTLLAAFELSNTELGAAQAIYGIVAMLAYFPGGLLADRFAARSLLALSLLATGLGGFYLASFPGPAGLGILFGYWGLTTILLFWAALIRATREWGGANAQGLAYGILDGGRGAFAAILATLATIAFATILPDNGQTLADADRRAALGLVIYGYTFATLLVALLCWLVVPRDDQASPSHAKPKRNRARVAAVLRLPAVWLAALIVLSAYVAYKGFDMFSLYAHEVWGMSEPDAASFSATLQWARPVAALAAGLLADRVSGSRVIVGCFALLLATDLYFGLGTPAPGYIGLMSANAAVSAAAIFGLRGVYFALLGEGSIPTAVTGTAVGFISVLGFTPDIFVAFVAGVLLDRSPGLGGHQHVFLFLAGFSVLGILAAAAFRRVSVTAKV